MIKGAIGIILAPRAKGKSYLKEANERAIKMAKELGYKVTRK